MAAVKPTTQRNKPARAMDGILDAAVTVFVRFGFRKTSMEEVARAANLSRQGLYLHFTSKEELFRAAVHHTLATSLAAALACLHDSTLTLEQRLVSAHEALMGKYVGMMGPNASDLAEAAQALLGPIMGAHTAQFADAVSKVLLSAKVAAAYRPLGLQARQLSEMLGVVAQGLKHSCTSRVEFRDGMTVAVRVLCAPVAGAR